ncbi:MAG: hypothetical protein AAF675_15240 [Pseudomonadota bacterium]
MAGIENALARLEAAIAGVEARVAAADVGPSAVPRAGTNGEQGQGIRDLFGDDREVLLARIASLEAQAREDEALRIEAAAAVQAALEDLRAVSEEAAGTEDRHA